MGKNDDANTNVDLAPLKTQRSTMKRHITNLKAKIDKNSAKTDASILECQLQLLENYYEQVSNIQTQIEQIDLSDNQRTELEDAFIAAKSKLLQLLNKPRASVGDKSMLNISATQHTNRLPKLKLPKFSGNYMEFSRFIHTFETLVDDDSSLSPIDKFNYLLDCLSGTAFAVVEPFQVSDENYDVALKRLKERFDNKTLIFVENIKALFGLQQMQKGSATSLRTLIDKVASIKSSLATIGTEQDVLNAMYIHLVTSKLDKETAEAYAEKQEFKKLPSFDDCYELLGRRCQYMESRADTSEQDKTTSPKSKQTGNKSAKSLLATKSSCSFCQSDEHTLSRCLKFEEAYTVPQRIEYATQNSLCKNCLIKGHSALKCPSKSRCRTCQGSHHTRLHLPKAASQHSSSTAATSEQPQGAASLNASAEHFTPRTTTSLLVRTTHRALIPTAVVLIKDSCGIYQPARAILDSASEINLITEETAKRLRLHQFRTTQRVLGIADTQTNLKFEVEATIRSRLSAFEWTSRFAATKSISNAQPGELIDSSQWTLPSNVEFADPAFFKPSKVDLLISSETFFDLLLGEKMSLGVNKPTLVNTHLGWIVGGKFSTQHKTTQLACHLATCIQTTHTDEYLKRFWELEEYVQPSPTYSEEEQRCEDHFVQNTVFSPDGRVQMAKRRFLSIERRLQLDTTLKQLYVEFMTEYERLGHMSPVSAFNQDEGFFIPHHPVLRPDSITTKLRVVFDASAKATSNISLNELMMVGPTIQQDIVTTLLAFRINRYALTADIRKMFRQFWVHKDDRKYQRILWRSDPQQQLQHYELNTITYGTSSAPYLAVRALTFIADAYQHLYPVGAEILRRDLYVDDVLTGADNIADLLRIKSELTNILALAKLELAKWNSNCSVIFEPSTEEVSINLADDVTKALGMAWNPGSDNFCYKFKIALDGVINKRSILSITAQIFDLLGLLSPVVIRCKILLQQLWIARIGWDEPLPDAFNEMWLQIRDDLPQINTIETPRYVQISPMHITEIHGFSDASERAFGCCIYCRVFNSGTYTSTLLIAKSKVAPVKAQSLPRLELCAALLLARTWHKFQHKFTNFITGVYFWTDSKTVLLWLQQHSSTLTTFVANRVSEIQGLTENVTWRHCPTKANPADIVSRGCSAAELSSTIWFTGPDFLRLDESEWPSLRIEGQPPPEEKRKTYSINHIKQPADHFIETLIANSSSYLHILRTVVYIRRVFNKVKANPEFIQNRNFPAISTAELDDAFHVIVSTIQRIHFAAEITSLERKKPLSPTFQRLTPFLSERSTQTSNIQLLHVGGRLARAPLPVEARFPLLMPKEHRFVSLYVTYLHYKNYHAGTKVLIGLLRQKLWILNAREVVGRVVRNCVHCFRYRPKLAQQIMGALPADRFHELQPFLVCGVDFCGPFLTSYRIRSKVPYKTYVAIFVCFASKAVHIELVSDLSSDAFIGCLKRFVARRGIPLRIHCDNATNFAGACNKLRQFYEQFLSQNKQQALFDHCSSTGFNFCFIPPRCPHFGGLWEAAVKSAKRLLMKHASEARLSYEELLTMTTEVEGILNCRPLAARSDDPNDGAALTPSHLIGGFDLKSIPEPRIEQAEISKLSRWQRLTYIKQEFWRQWLRDYVLELQTRSKWLTEQRNLEENQLVLIHDDNAPPQQWVLARITKVIPGSDGKIRVAEVQTSRGTLRRAIHKLAPLPMAS